MQKSWRWNGLSMSFAGKDGTLYFAGLTNHRVRVTTGARETFHFWFYVIIVILHRGNDSSESEWSYTSFDLYICLDPGWTSLFPEQFRFTLTSTKVRQHSPSIPAELHSHMNSPGSVCLFQNFARRFSLYPNRQCSSTKGWFRVALEGSS